MRPNCVIINTEKLNLEWVTKPRKGLGLSASMITNPYIKLGGTLGNPSIEMKPLEALTTTGAAVATAGPRRGPFAGSDRRSANDDHIPASTANRSSARAADVRSRARPASAGIASAASARFVVGVIRCGLSGCVVIPASAPDNASGPHESDTPS